MHKIIQITIFIFLSYLINGCVGINNSVNTKPNQLNNILQNFIESYANNNYFSAISATVRCNNNQISATAGSFESDNIRIIDTNSLFQIGSTTKSFTSAVILQLADNPKNNFSLNDTIGKWFKNLDGSPKYPLWQDVTVIQLMNMSSGIPDYANDRLTVIEKSLKEPNYYFSPDELLSTVESQNIIFPSGTGYHYSNTNYILLGILIEKITGNSPITEIENRIIKKLNLTHTYFPEHLPSEIVPMNQMVNGYVYFDFFPDQFKDLNGFYNRTLSSLSFYYTAGGIISTPEDLMTYIKALYTPEKLLTAERIKDLTSNYMIAQSPTIDYPNGGQPISVVSKDIPVGYGLGIFNIYESKPLDSYFMYNGATLGYGSYYAYYPKYNLYITFMINNGVNINSSKSNYQELINLIKQYAITTQCKK